MVTTPPSIVKVPLRVDASDGEILHGTVRLPPNRNGPLPVIIFSHGFKGFKDWGSIPYICESLARRGFLVLCFNFSHNGVEGDAEEFTRLDKFAANTFSREARELREIVDAVTAGRFPYAELADRERIGLVGHSRGGGITLLEAGSDPRIGAVAVWAAVSDFNRYTDGQKRRWREIGYFESKNMRTGQMMRMNVSLLDDLETNAAALDIGRATASLGRPLLILHGEQDLSVRIEEGERLAALADPTLTEFERLPHSSHTFGAAHPFQGSNPTLDHAIDRTASFFRNALGPIPH